MKINIEELKVIIDDLTINRDEEIKLFNKMLYSTVDYTEFLKHYDWYRNINNAYKWTDLWTCLR
jgi:hypothetical protein